MTTIACLIATYGGNEWLRLAADRALPSAGGQGFDDIVMTHLPDGALHTARNEAADHAKADYIVFLDGDDELHPGFCDAMRAAIDEADDGRRAQGFTPAVTYVVGRRRPPARIWPRVDLRDGNWLVIGTVVPRAAFLAVGGFADWPLYEDWCLWQRLEKHAGVEWVEVPDALYVAHAQPDSRNRGPSRRAKLAAHDMIRRANFPELYEQQEEQR